METQCAAWEDGTGFGCVIADRNHAIERLGDELVEMFGVMTADADACSTSACVGHGTGKTTDPRFGVVNTYHVSVLDELYKREG
jgi:hypothetical protein